MYQLYILKNKLICLFIGHRYTTIVEGFYRGMGLVSSKIICTRCSKERIIKVIKNKEL